MKKAPLLLVLLFVFGGSSLVLMAANQLIKKSADIPASATLTGPSTPVLLQAEDEEEKEVKEADPTATGVITNNGVVYTITASSAQEGNPARDAFDSSLYTRWASEFKGEWIQIDLNKVMTTKGIMIAFYNGDIRTTFLDIETSVDGKKFTSAASGLSGSAETNGLETFEFPDTKARYVRIIGQGNTANHWNSFTEIQIMTDKGLIPKY